MLGRRQQKYEAVESLPDDEVDVELKKRRIFTTPCLWYSLRTVLLIFTYFVPSIGLTFYQRWLYQSFRFPLTVVLIHLLVKYGLATVIRLLLIYQQGRPRVMLNWKEYIVAVSPTGIFSGIDIGLSNWGLELVTVSLYTMTKSTTIVFILAFAILFKLEKKSWSLCTIVVMISIGLFLFTYEATEFNVFGFVLLLFASVSSGVRWTCTQMLLQKSKMGMRNPIDMIYHMQPWMIASVLPFAIAEEAIPLLSNCQTFRSTEYSVFLSLASKILLGAVIAFFMEVTEVMVVTYTSSLTLSIAGIFKELFMLILAVVCNGDKMSPLNFVGLLVCLGGIISHVAHKIQTTHLSSTTTRFHDFEVEKFEVSESLINDSVDHLTVSSDSETEHSDTQVLFDILNRRER